MRAIKITYKKGLGKITDIQMYEFPDYFSEDYISGFRAAMETNENITKVERTND